LAIETTTIEAAQLMYKHAVPLDFSLSFNGSLTLHLQSIDRSPEASHQSFATATNVCVVGGGSIEARELRHRSGSGVGDVFKQLGGLSCRWASVLDERHHHVDL